MKLFKNIAGWDCKTSTRKNKGAISLEYILIIVVVVLVCLGAMRIFGSRVGTTINDSANAVDTTATSVFNQLSGGSGSGGSGGSGGTGGSGSGESGTNYVMLEYPTTIETSDISALFRSDAEYSKFVSVKVDDNVIAETNYTVTEGSTIVTLKQSYISTLPAGDHTLTIQSTDGYASSDFNVPGSTLDLTNIQLKNEYFTFASGDFSTKGNLVTINNKQFRVLDVNGTQVKVLSMEASSVNAKYNIVNNNITTFSDGYSGIYYANSSLDTAMTSYYESLSDTIKNAIIDQDIIQTKHNIDTGVWDTDCTFSSTNSYGIDYSLINRQYVNIGTRKVFALDVDDIYEYFGKTSITAEEITGMFFSSDISDNMNKNVWLRTAYKQSDTKALYVNIDGTIQNSERTSGYAYRPAFVIDLSLLS